MFQYLAYTLHYDAVTFLQMKCSFPAGTTGILKLYYTIHYTKKGSRVEKRRTKLFYGTFYPGSISQFVSVRCWFNIFFNYAYVAIATAVFSDVLIPICSGDCK